MIIFIAGITLFALGILMLWWAVSRHKKYTGAKEISKFPVSEDEQRCYLSKGTYTVDVCGGFGVYDLPLRIYPEIGKVKVDLYIQGLKYQYYKGSKRCVSYFYFTINEAGDYIFSVKDVEKVVVKESALKSKSFFSKKIDYRNLSLLVKEYRSPFTYIAVILAGIIGAWFTMLAVFCVLGKLGVISPFPFMEN